MFAQLTQNERLLVVTGLSGSVVGKCNTAWQGCCIQLMYIRNSGVGPSMAHHRCGKDRPKLAVVYSRDNIPIINNNETYQRDVRGPIYSIGKRTLLSYNYCAQPSGTHLSREAVHFRSEAGTLIEETDSTTTVCIVTLTHITKMKCNNE